MNQDRTKRKLTAILSADVVGYSRMMEADEAWTIKSLEENKNLFSKLISEYEGRVVDAPGDNILAEFTSVINAVECAVKIQQELKAKNSKLMETHRMEFRIGINLGDVVEEDGRIYGNGVNIAARLEGLAEPGGLCISHTAYDQVKSKIEVDYDYLGEYQVKNINEPVRVYRILMGGESTEKYILHNKSHKRVISLGSAVLSFIILLAVAVGTTIAILSPKTSEPPQVTRFFVELPEGYAFADQTGPNLAISPNGSQFAVTTSKGIYLRLLNELNMKPVSGTMGKTRQPFFSPDGEWIGYWSMDDNQLKKISVAGGSPIPLCKDDPVLGYYHWGTDGNIYYSGGKGIIRVSEKGGIPETVIASKNNETFFSPQLLPDEKSVMFTIDAGDQYEIAVQSLYKNDRRNLFKGSTAVYLSPGYLIYIFKNDLNAAPFNIEKLKPTGSPVTIVEDILINGPPHFCVSNSGTFAYLRNINSKRSFVWVNMDGTEEKINAASDIYSFPRISPDGDRVAMIISDDISNNNIGIMDIARGIIMSPNQNIYSAWGPIWHPDSQRIVFSDSPGGAYSKGVYQMLASNGKIDHLYSEPMRQIYTESFSKDGKTLLCLISQPGSTAFDLGVLTTVDEPQWKLILDDKYIKIQPKLSPDNKWLAYTSNNSGQNEVYVRSFPEAEEVCEKISANGGDDPLWSPNSDQLYYRSGDSVISVTYEAKGGFRVINSKVLFRGEYYSASLDPSWDIHPAGKRFLMMKEDPADSSNADKSRPRIDIVLNWFEELKERVPVD